MKLCSRCRLTKEANDFGVDNSRLDGRKPWCRECCRAWRKNNPEKERAKNAKYYVANREAQLARVKGYDPVKKRAQTLLNEAVDRGKVIKPPVCNVCGSSGPVDGHHFNYDEPLAVLWVCRGCHKAIHAFDIGPDDPEMLKKLCLIKSESLVTKSRTYVKRG